MDHRLGQTRELERFLDMAKWEARLDILQVHQDKYTWMLQKVEVGFAMHVYLVLKLVRLCVYTVVHKKLICQ